MSSTLQTLRTRGLILALSSGILCLSSFAETYSSSQIKSFIESPYISWGLDAKRLPSGTYAPFNKKNIQEPTINIAPALKIFNKRKDIIVAVIDTGINLEHSFLKDNVVNQFGKKSSKTNFGLDFSSGKKDKKNNIVSTTTPNDTHGHGSHVSGIIKSIFPDVRILPIKYYNPKASGQDNLNATLKALRAAIDANVDIINYSGGGPEECAEERALLAEAQKKGILVVAASGNESTNLDAGKDNAYYPASYNMTNIISVAAYNFNGSALDLIPSSNYGSQSVDIAAPGYKIQSASIQDKDAMTGTSQATAFVTGVAALIKSMYPELNPEEIKNIIISSAPEVENFKKKMVSSGKLDAYAALTKASLVGKALIAAKQTTDSAKKKITTN